MSPVQVVALCMLFGCLCLLQRVQEGVRQKEDVDEEQEGTMRVL